MRCTQLCAQWAVQSGAVVVVGISQPRQCWTWGRALPHALLSPFSISAMRGPWCAPVAQPCCQRRAALPQGRIGCGWDKVQWGLILCPHPILGLPEPRTRTILLSCSESVRRGKSALLLLQECSAPSRGRCCSRGGRREARPLLAVWVQVAVVVAGPCAVPGPTEVGGHPASMPQRVGPPGCRNAIHLPRWGCQCAYPKPAPWHPQEATGHPTTHWDEQVALVLALQRCQLAGCQQGQAQLLHGQSGHLGYRALQDSLWAMRGGWLEQTLGGVLGRCPPCCTHRADVRPLPHGLHQVQLICSQVVAAQHPCQHRVRQLVEAPCPHHCLRVHCLNQHPPTALVPTLPGPSGPPSGHPPAWLPAPSPKKAFPPQPQPQHPCFPIPLPHAVSPFAPFPPVAIPWCSSQ